MNKKLGLDFEGYLDTEKGQLVTDKQKISKARRHKAKKVNLKIKGDFKMGELE